MTAQSDKGVKKQQLAETSGALGSNPGSALGGRRSPEPPKYGSVFRSIMSSSRLDTMVAESPAAFPDTKTTDSPPMSPVVARKFNTVNSSVDLQQMGQLSQNVDKGCGQEALSGERKLPGTIIGSLFRSVKSCSRLDELDKSVPAGGRAGLPTGSPPTKGFWFGGLSSYLEKSRITARDLNVVAPSSS